MSVTIQVTTDLSDLEKLVKELQEPQDVYRVIGESLVKSADDGFEAQADPYGSAWAKWSPHTVALYARGGLFKNMRARPERILQNTGTLRRSVHYEAHADSVTIRAGGNARAYAAVHQFGNQANRLPNNAKGSPAPIPPRPYFPVAPDGSVRLPDAWARQAVERLEDFFDVGGAP